MIDKNLSKEFPKCPCCKAESALVHNIGKEMKDQHLAREDWTPCMDVKQGIVLDQNYKVLLPVGKIVNAGYVIQTDVCTECGCVWAVKVQRAPARISAQQRGQQPGIFGAQ